MVHSLQGTYQRISLYVLGMAVFVAIFCLPVFARAQESVVDETTTSSSPQIYLNTLKLNQTNFVTGDKVKGSFILENGANEILPDLFYRIYLIGAPNSEGVYEEYGSTISGPIVLKANESRYVPFEYVLPKGVVGKNLSIQVAAITKDDIQLVFDEIPVSISGVATPVTISRPMFRVNDTQNDNQRSALYIGKEDMINGAISLTNSSDLSVTVVPHVIIYNESNITKPVIETDIASFIVDAKKTKPVNFVIPHTTDSGVSVAILSFRNPTTGQQVGSVARFYFIVRGETASISLLRADKSSVTKGETINLTLNYMGTLFDEGLTLTEKQPAVLTVNLLDEQGNKVGEYTEPIDLAISVQDKIVPIQALLDASAIKADARITKNGVVLAQLVTPLSEGFKDQQSAPIAKPIEEINMPLFAGSVILLLVMIIIYMFSRRNKITPIPPTVVLLLAGVLLGVLGFIQMEKASAGDITTFTVVSANPNNKWYPPGAKVTGQVLVKFRTNTSNNVTVTASGKFASKSICSKSRTGRWDGPNLSVNCIFSFTAPSTPGLYKIIGTGTNTVGPSGSKQGLFTVPAPDVVADVCPFMSGVADPAIQTSVPVGMTVDGAGNCTPVVVVTDFCPNIVGTQATVPAGMMVDATGNCVPVVVGADLCPNIAGSQATVPAGMMVDGTGNCVPVAIIVDVCPNIAGNQPTPPIGKTIDPVSGLCVDIVAPSCAVLHAAQIGNACNTGIGCAVNDGTFMCDAGGNFVCQPNPGFICTHAAVTLTATPEYVNKGESCQLSWTAVNAESCTLTTVGETTATKSVDPASTGESSGPLNAKTTYTFTCNGTDLIPVSAPPFVCRINQMPNEI